MLRTLCLVFLAVAALLPATFILSGHLVGPLVYLSTSSPSQNSLATLRTLGVLPPHCAYVTATPHNRTIYTPAGSVITADTKISLMSASKLISAILVLSVFPDPDTVRIDNVLPPHVLQTIPQAALNITVRELLSMTAGLEQGTCEAAASGWQDCVVELLSQHYNPTRRGHFFYARSHWTVAGYLASYASNKTWDALLDEYIRQPAGVQPAQRWDAPELSHGQLAFDAPVDAWNLRGDELHRHQQHLLHHPVPSSGLAGSAQQLATVLSAVQTGKIGNEHLRQQLFQPHAKAGGWLLWETYAAGNWRSAHLAHSQGMFGTFPYIYFGNNNDQSGWVGVFVMDSRRSAYWRRIAKLIGYFETSFLNDSKLLAVV